MAFLYHPKYFLNHNLFAVFVKEGCIVPDRSILVLILFAPYLLLGIR